TPIALAWRTGIMLGICREGIGILLRCGRILARGFRARPLNASWELSLREARANREALPAISGHGARIAALSSRG
ncbi:MAG TPA: hypothetical protein VLJ84_09550, partial [Usitatibacter sp.]|nr:hypothetical protein [Usitatibacter sp.]